MVDTCFLPPKLDHGNAWSSRPRGAVGSGRYRVPCPESSDAVGAEGGAKWNRHRRIFYTKLHKREHTKLSLWVQALEAWMRGDESCAHPQSFVCNPSDILAILIRYGKHDCSAGA